MQSDMKEPVLVIMAAGMGSRFGGPKQIKAIDEFGHAIIDYSLYDAKRAGFKKVAFIIKHAIEDDFKAAVGRRAEAHFDVTYIYQELSVMPEGYSVPDGRVKPWGTGHAVLCCKEHFDAPFAVINADDFYGRSAYEEMYKFLTTEKDPTVYSMVGYRLCNTVTDNGYVARGICQTNGDLLSGITERTHIEKDGDGIVFIENGEKQPISGDSVVSMNFWGFSSGILAKLEHDFTGFLDNALKENPLKAEYFLPFVVNDSLEAGECSVRILKSNDSWYGMTYLEDLDTVKAAVSDMRSRGVYPAKLLD